MTSDKESQIRATFKDTKKSQKEFRDILNNLIKHNKPIDVDKREKFLDVVADSNFGLGTKELVFYLNNGKCLKIDNFEEFIRGLVYYDKSVVGGEFFFKILGRYKDYNVDIGELWEHIRIRCGGVWAEALAMSVRISKEQTHFGPSEAARV